MYHLGALFINHQALINLVGRSGTNLVGIHYNDGDTHDIDAFKLSCSIAGLDVPILQVLLSVKNGIKPGYAMRRTRRYTVCTFSYSAEMSAGASRKLPFKQF